MSSDPADPSVEDPAPSAGASGAGTAYDGPGAELLERYAGRLAGDGVVRGLIGPREVDRLWDRHLINCAAVAPLFPIGARVVDVGSGAGLPGVVLACVREDLRIDLLDSLQRRTAFLAEVAADLGIADRVRVVTGRAEDRSTIEEIGDADWVTARAVAPLARLAEWCLPLLRTGGRLAALKGARAEVEIQDSAQAVRRAGGAIDGIRQFPESGVALARVVVVRREPAGRPGRKRPAGGGARPAGRGTSRGSPRSASRRGSRQ